MVRKFKVIDRFEEYPWYNSMAGKMSLKNWLNTYMLADGQILKYVTEEKHSETGDILIGLRDTEGDYIVGLKGLEEI